MIPTFVFMVSPVAPHPVLPAPAGQTSTVDSSFSFSIRAYNTERIQTTLKILQ
jgi:hypothetical protein